MTGGGAPYAPEADSEAGWEGHIARGLLAANLRVALALTSYAATTLTRNRAGSCNIRSPAMPSMQIGPDPVERLRSIKVPGELSAANGLIGNLIKMIQSGHTVEPDSGDPIPLLVLDLAATVAQMVEAWNKRSE